MTFEVFKRLVRREFGTDLHRLTPANAREFLDRLQSQGSVRTLTGKWVIDEKESTYEGIVRDFLSKALEMPLDQAVILLWLYSLEFTTASVTELEQEKFARLFAHLGTGEGAD